MTDTVGVSHPAGTDSEVRSILSRSLFDELEKYVPEAALTLLVQNEQRAIPAIAKNAGLIAEALGTYRFKENIAEAVHRIISLIDEYAIDVVVLGYPKHMNNDVGIRGRISEDVSVAIQKERPVEVILWDERLSTQSALKVMIDGGVRRQRQKKKKDELAAVLILQNYLDYMNNKRKGAS